ncbi:MAG TPA: response regulator transcription factor [Limnobacter sp.]|nr:response regulator transcription factor [Limnobacter sp.]
MRHLLILEDHPTSAMVTEEIFRAILKNLQVKHFDTLSALLKEDPFKVDLVVSDLMLPGSSPSEVVSAIASRFPTSVRIFFTGLLDDETRSLVEQSGALHLAKNAKYKDLLSQVQVFLQVHVIDTQGESVRNEYQSNIQMPGSSKPLTIKQAKVMEQVCLGHTAKEIAKILGMSPDTVNAHVKEAFHRLNAQNRAEAISNYMLARKIAERLHGEAVMEQVLP